jgi:hypothetical protein
MRFDFKNIYVKVFAPLTRRYRGDLSHASRGEVKSLVDFKILSLRKFRLMSFMSNQELNSRIDRYNFFIYDENIFFE